jgi:hypothetical protein
VLDVVDAGLDGSTGDDQPLGDLPWARGERRCHRIGTLDDPAGVDPGQRGGEVGPLGLDVSARAAP